MIKIAKFTFNPFQESTFVVWDETMQAIIIDAGNYTPRETQTLEQFIDEQKLTPVMAVNTHGHVDHLLGVAALKERYSIPFAIDKRDAFLVDSAATHGSLYGFNVAEVPTIDIDLEGKRSIEFGNSSFEIIETPGHTPGHIALYNPQEKILFTGDTLFKESIGRTDLPGGDYSWIMKSILNKLAVLDGATKIYPGHGPESTIGHEMLYNPFITEVINNEVNYN